MDVKHKASNKDLSSSLKISMAFIYLGGARDKEEKVC